MSQEVHGVDNTAQAEKLLTDLKFYNTVQVKLMRRKLGEEEGSNNFEMWIDCCSPEYREAFFRAIKSDPDFLTHYEESEGEALQAVEEKIEMLQRLERELVKKLTGDDTDPRFLGWHRENASRVMRILHANQELAEPFLNHTHDDVAEEQDALTKIEVLLKGDTD